MNSSGASPPRIFTIPPGVSFLGTLADTLLSDRLRFGLADPLSDPLALARVTIYLPTRRAARALRSEIADRIGRGSAILPVIRPLGESDDDSNYFDEASPAGLDLDPSIGGTEAVLQLAELVHAWKQTLPRAIVDRFDGAPIMAPANPADAVWLAQSLFGLIQSMETEEVDFAALDGVIEDDLQEWWQITAEFLRIARQYWPAALAERHRTSPAQHHNVLIDAEARRIAGGGHKGPLIVAGSTGSRPSTARLIAAIARHPEGAVVLPGLDQNMTETHWRLLADQVEAPNKAEARKAEVRPGEALSSTIIRSHPQYGLFRLLDHLGMGVDEIVSIPALTAAPSDLGTRNRLVSLALLPASATNIWSDPGVIPASSELQAGLEQITCIEASNEREEACAVAAAMRAALEPEAQNPEPVAALVTPDRNLARRVVIELARHGIEANDSGGTRLTSTRAGSLARLALETAFSPGDPVTIAALIKHPLARFGKPADTARRAGELIELLALRGETGEAAIDGLAAAVLARARLRNERHAPQWLARLNDSEIDLAAAHAADVERALEPLSGTFLQCEQEDDSTSAAMAGSAIPVALLAARTAEALEMICADDTSSSEPIWENEAGRALAAILLDCRETSSSLAMTGFEWIGAFDALLSTQVIKPETGGHPRAFVWGTLEARLQHVDTLLLGGLNEGTWPAPGMEDPFLSRSMKAAMGLEPPERRIGQAAHDFQMAMGAQTVILSRALRAGKSPTVASRWLQRLKATAGADVSGQMDMRGAAILAHIRALDEPAYRPGPGRPAPMPAPDTQPSSYSFSEVGTLRRDPYAIYARRILDLDAMAPFIAEPGPRERGTLYHAILEEFVAGFPQGRREKRLMEIADRHFADASYPEEIRAVWRNRFARFAPILMKWEEERSHELVSSHIETRGRLEMPGGLVLRGKADRIDLCTDGSAQLIDYKTGTSPTIPQARTLLDPQLALEAHVLLNGGFHDIGPRTVSGMLYVRLTGKEKIADRIDADDADQRGKDEVDNSAEALAERAVREFSGLVEGLRTGRLGFMSRVRPKAQRDFSGDYDHLARVAEWQTANEGEGGDG